MRLATGPAHNSFTERAQLQLRLAALARADAEVAEVEEEGEEEYSEEVGRVGRVVGVGSAMTRSEGCEERETESERERGKGIVPSCRYSNCVTTEQFETTCNA